MEQYTYQQQIIVEPAKAKKPVGLQIAALITGVVGLALACPAYFCMLVFSGFTAASSVDQSLPTLPLGAALVFGGVILVLCFVAMILGIVGLVRSIRRPTRSIKGIIMSAIGLNCAGAGFALIVVGFAISGVIAMMIQSGMLH